MLDIEQRDRELIISYFKDDGTIGMYTINLPESEMYNWYYSNPRGHNVSKEFLSWDRKPIKKAPSKKLTKYRIWEILDHLDQDIKDEIFTSYQPKKFFMDIEVGVGDEFPNPEDAKNEVTTIGFCNENGNVFVMGTKPLGMGEREAIQTKINKHLSKFGIDWKFKYMQYKTERIMLAALAHKVLPKMYAVTGWNFTQFDWTYLVNRCSQYDINLPKEMSPTNTEHGRLRQPNHRLIVDYLEIYAKWDRSVDVKETNSLDWVASKVLGVNKVNYPGTLSELYEKDYNQYVWYNAIDCALVYLLDQKLQTFSTFIALSKAAEVPLLQSFSSSYCVERQMFSELYKKNLIMVPKPKGFDNAISVGDMVGIDKKIFDKTYLKRVPNPIHVEKITKEMNGTAVYRILEVSDQMVKLKDKNGYEFLSNKAAINTIDEGYAGAYVMEPTPGLYENVVSFDFASMYPSIMRQYNIGSDSYLGEINADDPSTYITQDGDVVNIDKNSHITTSAAKDLDDNISGTYGSVFSKNEDSALKIIITRLYAERYEKKHMANDIATEIDKLEKMLK